MKRKHNDNETILWQWGHGYFSGGVQFSNVLPTLRTTTVTNWLTLIIEIDEHNTLQDASAGSHTTGERTT